MAQGNRIYKLELATKIGFVVTFLAYLAFSQTFISLVLREEALWKTIKLKSNVTHQAYENVIVGGSNALYGLRAELISANGQPSYNFSISAAEGGTSFDYSHWLAAGNNTANTVIYSSMNFWFLNAHAPFGEMPAENFTKNATGGFSAIPLASWLYQFFKKQNSVTISSHGDLDPVQCEKAINPFPIYLTVSPRNNLNHTPEFIQKIESLKLAYRAKTIYVRIPPVYIASETRPAFELYMAEATTALFKSGIKVIGVDNALTDKKEYMCFGPNHPNSDWKDRYTLELLKELRSLSQLNAQTVQTLD